MKITLLQLPLIDKYFKGSTQFVTFLSILTLLFCGNIAAQTTPFVNGQNTLSTAINAPVDVTTADVDGDGDQDIISASALDGIIAWFPNDGSGAFGSQQNIVTALFFVGGIVTGDMDSDGDMDVISFLGSSDTIFWFANDGLGNFGTQQTITTIADGVRSIAIADINDDGNLDVLSASIEDNRIAWYENNGSGTFGTQQTISTAAIGANVVATADLDGDGDLDVLSTSVTDNRLAWYENDGTGIFGSQNTIVSSINSPNDITTADLDGDGDLDVLSASTSDDRIAWFENNGTGSFGGQQTITTAADGAQKVITADVDGDGDLDVLSASANDDRIAFYINDGLSVFGAQQTISTLADSARSIAASDLDDDGDLDVISASFNDDRIAWYENSSPKTEITINATALMITASGSTNEHITLTNSGTTLTITNNRNGFIINGTTTVSGNSTTVELVPTMTEIIIDGTTIDNNRLDLNVDYNFGAANITTQNIAYVHQTGNVQTTTGNIALNTDNGIHVNGTIQSTTGAITLRGSQKGMFGESTVVLDGIIVNATGMITSVDGNISLKASSMSSDTVQRYGVYIDGGAVTTTGAGAIEIIARAIASVIGSPTINYGGYLNSATLSTVNGDISVLGMGAVFSSNSAGLVIRDSTISSSGSGNIDLHTYVELTIVDDYFIMENTDVSVVDGNLSITADTDEVNTVSGLGEEDVLTLDGCNISSTGTGTIDILVLGSLTEQLIESDGIALRIKNWTSISSVYGDITIYSRSKNMYTGASNGAIYATDFNIISTGTGPNAANISITGEDGTIAQTPNIVNLRFWSLTRLTEGHSKIKSVDGDITFTALSAIYGFDSGSIPLGDPTFTFCVLEHIDLDATGDGDVSITADYVFMYDESSSVSHVMNARNVNITTTKEFDLGKVFNLSGNLTIKPLYPDLTLGLNTVNNVYLTDNLEVTPLTFSSMQISPPGEFFFGDAIAGDVIITGNIPINRPSNIMGANILVRNLTSIDDTVRLTALPGGVIREEGIHVKNMEVGVVEMNGKLAPGDIGTLGSFKVIGDVALSSGDTLAIDLFTADNDTLQMLGFAPVFHAGDAILDLNMVTMPSASTEIIIIDIAGNEPVVGTFLGLPEGTDITIGSELYRISYLGGTGNDVSLTNTSTLSVLESELGTITVYPNPAQNQITITNDANHYLQFAEIYDLMGRLVKTKTLNNSSINIVDVSQLESATYIVKITSNQANIIKQFVKQ